MARRLRTGALVAAAPVLRQWINRRGHEHRLAAIRRFLPGSTLQISEELIGFAELAASRSAASVCEIGTYNGGTSLFLCGLPTVRRYVGIDIQPFNERAIKALAPRHVDLTILKGSSRDLRERVGADFDVLFIDGDHTYDGAKADFLDYRGLVRPGGLIAFHDIVPDQGHDEVWSGDVPKLWREVRDEYRHWEFVAEPDQAGFGIGVLESRAG